MLDLLLLLLDVMLTTKSYRIKFMEPRATGIQEIKLKGYLFPEWGLQAAS